MSGHCAAGEGRDSQGASFIAEAPPMVNDLALFVLPLVNHFVEERVERFVPSVTQDMMPADDDFRWNTFG